MVSIRRYENFHIFLWLLKDTCWLMDFHVGGMVMIVPTLLAAFHITYLSRKYTMDFIHNLAVSCWIIANGIWMVGEFYYNDTTRPYAFIFFAIGLAIVGTYYLGVLPWRYFNGRKTS
ncbi:hypothetical protein BH09BAC1_BH09BAC1_20420 [soil metagenome]